MPKSRRGIAAQRPARRGFFPRRAHRRKKDTAISSRFRLQNAQEKRIQTHGSYPEI